MARDRFLSSTNTQAILAPSTAGRQATLNLTQDALNVVGEKFNRRLSEFERKEREAEQLNKLAMERKRQLELAVPELTRNIQKAQLNTFNVVLGLQESIRKQQASKEADAFSLKSNYDTKLSFAKSQRELIKNSKPNGDGILTNVQAWWDEKEKQIINSAPSELAKMQALDNFYKQKNDALFDAINLEGQVKEEFNQRQVVQAEDNIIGQAVSNPRAYVNALNNYKDVGITLKNLGLSNDEIKARKAGFEAKLLDKTINAALDRVITSPELANNELPIISNVLLKDLNNVNLSSDKLSDISKKYVKAVDKVRNITQKSKSEYQARVDITKGNADPANPVHVKIVEQDYKDMHTKALNLAKQSSDNPSEQAAVFAQSKLNFVRNSPFIPKSEIKRIETRLSMVEDPHLAVAEASYVLNLANNKDTINKFDGFSKEAIFRASLITAYAETGLSPKAVMERVNDDLNKQKDGFTVESRKADWQNNIISASGTSDSSLRDIFGPESSSDFTSWLSETVYADEIGEESFLDRWNFFNTIPEDTLNQLHEEYKSIAKEVHILGKSEQETLDITAAIMKKRWGVRSVEGRAELMYNPPERFFKGYQKDYFDSIAKEVSKSHLGGRSLDEFELIYSSQQGDKINWKLRDRSTQEIVQNTVDGLANDLILSVSRKGAEIFSLEQQKDDLALTEIPATYENLLEHYNIKNGRYSGQEVPKEFQQEIEKYFLGKVNPAKQQLASVEREIEDIKERIKIRSERKGDPKLLTKRLKGLMRKKQNAQRLLDIEFELYKKLDDRVEELNG